MFFKLKIKLILVICSITVGSSAVKFDESSNGESPRIFPEGFKFGVATSSYQIEGSWNVTDKGISIWDYATHNQSQYFHNGATGGIACDSYHHYKRDVEMLRELNVDFYRFSVSWPRILPSGYANHISVDGLAYYNNLINEMVKYDIEPVISIYHWELPQSFQELGGWTNPLSFHWFVDFARVLFENYGDRVNKWITFNEAAQLCNYGYGFGDIAPFWQRSGEADYLCIKNVLLAHAKTYRMYQSEFKSKFNGKIGIGLNLPGFVPETESPEDIEATEDYNLFYNYLMAHPIFSADGDYPNLVKERVSKRSTEQGYLRSRLPELTREEIELIRGTYDYFGLNHYCTFTVRRTQEYVSQDHSFYGDAEAMWGVNEEWPGMFTSIMKVYIEGLRMVLREIRDKYSNPEIWIFENGFSTAPQDGVNDDNRIKYIRDNLAAIADSIAEDGTNVAGYTVWSLMDSFEWTAGYSERFGLYHIDFEDPTRARIPKKSAAVYRHICRTKTLDYDYEPDTFDISLNE